MQRNGSFINRPVLTWEQEQARIERRRQILSFEYFCRQQQARVSRSLNDMEHRLHLGPQIEPAEMEAGRLVVEARR